MSSSHAFLPLTPDEVAARGWDAVDVVFVSGDAYVDHPSFAMALLGRVLAAAGFRVALLCQPDWHGAAPWRAFGRPRVCFAVSAGNMDSMVNHYTSARKPRSEDAYSPGGARGRRPDRATLAYCQRAREAFPGVPIIAGGVEASLRRLAHYDYWSDTVRGSIVLDAKCDLLVYGNGEEAIVRLVRALAAGAAPRDLRGEPGLAYALGRTETPPADVLLLPSLEEVRADPAAFARATRLIHREQNPWTGRRLGQQHGDRLVIQNPPRPPLDEAALDAAFDLPYQRAPHPSYAERIPAYETVRHSVAMMRGCFGGCTFCSITLHEGKTVQSRSAASIAREVDAIARMPDFTGTISDLGGPTANMWRMRCTDPHAEARCRRPSCVHPKICPLLNTDHAPLRELMALVRAHPAVKRVFVASGVRMDLALRDPDYVRDLARHHVGGHLKVAPEHTDPDTLRLMRKPPVESFEDFRALFERCSREAGKEQYLVPYFIAAHPGTTLDAMIDLACFLKREGFRPRQVQDFLPAPMDMATAMYHTGLHPDGGAAVPVARRERERQWQRALLHYWKPENAALVREALRAAGRADLIGRQPAALVAPAAPRRGRPRGGSAPAGEGERETGNEEMRP